MLLIGIIGDVGDGKSTLLTKLADWWREQGKTPDGFIAVAGERIPGRRGAERYTLLLLRESSQLPYALHDTLVVPPYVFDAQTEFALTRWADHLKDNGSPSLVIIDEFGPREAAGNGHIALWDRVRDARPEIVIAAVRKGLEASIEERLGARFQILIDVASGDSWERLRQSCAEHSDWLRVGVYGGGAGGFEASVGAILHGGQIPLRGLAMSSMQSVIMTYAADGMGKRRRVVWVAVIAAALKALSPTGNRARPMIAITAQGFLYTLAVTLLGWNILGVTLGGFLIGAWAAIQGVVLQYLFVGNELLEAYDTVIQYIVGKLDLHGIGFLQIVVAWTILCGLLSGALTLVAWRHRRRMPGRLRDLVFRKPRGVILEWNSVSIGGAMRNGLKDITRPLFWLPVIIVIAMMFASGSSVETILWIVLRAAVVGFVLFSLVRSIDLRRFIGWLQHRGHWGPALAFKRAVEGVGGTDDPPTRDDNYGHV